MRKELILEIIQDRWSPYSFSPAPIEEFRLKAMMEAAGCAPSCFNEQPWLFIYVTRDEKEVFEQYLGFLSDVNREWAKNAYAIIIGMARLRFTANGKPNRFALYDTGMAVSNMLAQAFSMDIYVHQMGGYDVEKVKKYFNLSNDVEPAAVMAAGHLGNGESLSPELFRRDEVRRGRKSVNEYVFRNNLTVTGFGNQKGL